MKAHARRTDPWTSHEAAASVSSLSRKQIAVLGCFRRHGRMTDEELRHNYDGEPQSPSGLRTRRHELAARGLLHPVDESTSRSNRPVLVWDMRDGVERQLSLFDALLPIDSGEAA
ncbi:MAG: hypothetical protein M3401_17880 [Actinomycetota bacterium]|nr:hypothetical protein [Actinomycetota bacterium]